MYDSHKILVQYFSLDCTGVYFRYLELQRVKPLMLHRKKNNKNTRERIYIPSLLLHCAAAGSLDVEAVAVTL